jgi:hypothetical protein
MNRREVITLLSGVAATLSLSALAAQSSEWRVTSRSGAVDAPPRIGWLKIQGPQHTPGQLKAFRDGMRELGVIEGRDYLLEERYAANEGARLPGLQRSLSAGVSGSSWPLASRPLLRPRGQPISCR